MSNSKFYQWFSEKSGFFTFLGLVLAVILAIVPFVQNTINPSEISIFLNTHISLAWLIAVILAYFSIRHLIVRFSNERIVILNAVYYTPQYHFKITGKIKELVEVEGKKTFLVNDYLTTVDPQVGVAKQIEVVYLKGKRICRKRAKQMQNISL
ncbi:MAG TPA: hypothetical protein VJT83_02545 [Chitinophagaceae bacterium]|nr:hypothetical protein [Chitinophagaceae bacterium]